MPAELPRWVGGVKVFAEGWPTDALHTKAKWAARLIRARQPPALQPSSRTNRTCGCMPQVGHHAACRCQLACAPPASLKTPSALDHAVCRVPSDRRWRIRRCQQRDGSSSAASGSGCGALRQRLPRRGRQPGQSNAAVSQRAAAGAEQAAVYLEAAQRDPHSQRRRRPAAAPAGIGQWEGGRGQGESLAQLRFQQQCVCTVVLCPT